MSFVSFGLCSFVERTILYDIVIDIILFRCRKIIGFSGNNHINGLNYNIGNDYNGVIDRQLLSALCSTGSNCHAKYIIDRQRQVGTRFV